MTAIRLLLVDDHQIVRQGLRSLLEQDLEFEIIGEAANAEDALKLVKSLEPDVVLLDLQLPDGGGASLCQRLVQTCPTSRILILTAFLNRSLVDACLRAGARGYLVKDAENLHLKGRIRAVMEGKTVIDPKVASIIAEHLRTEEPLSGALTPRELEVMVLIAEGLSNREIGERLSVTENTVKGHVKEILSKLNAPNRVTAVMKARLHNLI